MPASLFVEHYGDGLAFYINGELQFHTIDEQIYHEYLVVPAITLAVQRFGGEANLRVLICGGGDGLAAREVLRFSQVEQIDLVDYDPEVIELGKTVFAPYNHHSLVNDKVKIHTDEAFAFLANAEQNLATYHAIICDFTFPSSTAETSIYSQEWYQLLKSYLHPEGLIATNAVSSDRHTKAFWCIYQTLRANDLNPLPMQVEIPSFQRHGYGTWGFLFASDRQITTTELAAITLPAQLKTLNLEALRQKFVFKTAIASLRDEVEINTLNAPRLFYYLLNSLTQLDEPDSTETHDFLENQDLVNDANLAATEPPKSSEIDPLQLESLAKLWIEKIGNSSASLNTSEPIDLAQLNSLLPVQHPYHTPPMMAEWLGATQQLLAQIDLTRLLPKILERAKDLPPQLVKDLQDFKSNLEAHRSEESQNSLTPSVAKTASQVLLITSLTLLFANVIAPDAVFGKGSYVGDGSGGDSGWGPLGLVMTMSGVIWLLSLVNDDPNNSEDR